MTIYMKKVPKKKKLTQSSNIFNLGLAFFIILDK